MDRKVKIMAVDDSPGVLALLEDFFARNDYDFFGTLDPDEARVHFLERGDADVVFVDMMLGPKIEIGMRLVSDLRRAGFQGFIAVLSACPPESNGWQMFFRVGANDMLEKCSDIEQRLPTMLDKAKKFNANIYPPELI